VSIHGPDASAGLESTEDVLKLLNTHAILLLFSPSLALLQVVKKAIKTQVDLPKLKFEEGKPLIVHKIHGFDRYHIVPGFSLASGQVESPGDSASTLAKFCVDLIGKSVAFASDPAVVSQLTQDDLSPPSDANFVYRIAPVTWYYEIGNNEYTSYVGWTVWLCSFATNYVPGDPGCKVYTIMRFGGGTAGLDLSSVMGSKFSFDYQAAQRSTRWLWTHQEPQTYQVQVKDGYQYNIDYRQTFSLLKNAGTTPYPWTASYNETFHQVDQQTPSEPDGWTRRFHLEIGVPWAPFVFSWTPRWILSSEPP